MASPGVAAFGVLGLVVLLVVGSLVGVAAGVVAVVSRAALGYRRTAGYLAFLVERLLDRSLDTDRLGVVLAAELAWYAALGVGLALVVMGLGLYGHLPSFYGALSYSAAAVRALTLVCVGYAVGVGLLVVFLTDAGDRDRYFDASGLAGLAAGLLGFAVASRATILMTMYPRTHHELSSRAATRLPFGWVLDLLPMPDLAVAFAGLAAVPIALRRLDGPVRDWQVLLGLGVLAALSPIAGLWAAVTWPSLVPGAIVVLRYRVGAVGILAILLAGLLFNVD